MMAKSAILQVVALSVSQSKPALKVLLTDNRHDFHGISPDLIVDAVRAADTAAVSNPDVVDGWV
jgi:hypothetical protein